VTALYIFPNNKSGR